ncbi:MAG: glycosyltransferase family 2 protein [Acidobacteriaceae bacterium]
MSLSVCIITHNEAANLPRTLASVRWADELVVVDSGSTDRTCDIGREFGAHVFIEPWSGFAPQKDSALSKATSDWILSLDADEEVTPELAASIQSAIRTSPAAVAGYFLPRRNLFLHRWIKHGGFYPDPKLRLWRRGAGHFEQRPVHETACVAGTTATLSGDLIHHSYPTLAGYIEHMNRYSTLGSEDPYHNRTTPGAANLSGTIPLYEFLMNVVLRPQLTFFYNYFIRLGFLDGREGLLLHLYHSTYVSWKYAKAWERARTQGLR